MIRYSFKHLSYFVAAAELKSTSAAARSLHVSQPSVSAAIQHLEALFGHTLVIRHKGQGITPTPHGRQLMKKAKQILELANNLHTENDDELAGSVVLGCFVDISPYYLPVIINELQGLHPKIHLRIINDELRNIPPLLKHGELDMAITYDLLPEAGIIHEHLQTIIPQAMLPENHRLAKLSSIPLQELLKEPLIICDAPHSGNFLVNVLNGLGLTSRIAHNVQTFELQRSMVANGLGVSLVYTRPKCSKSYDGKELVFRPLTEILPAQNLVLARNSLSELTPVTRAVLRLICDKLREPTPSSSTAQT